MITTKYYEQVPPENRVLTCPYCNKEQHMYDIRPRMHTNKELVAYNCDHCGKLFRFIQIVERIYVAIQIKGPKDQRTKGGD